MTATQQWSVPLIATKSTDNHQNHAPGDPRWRHHLPYERGRPSLLGVGGSATVGSGDDTPALSSIHIIRLRVRASVQPC